MFAWSRSARTTGDDLRVRQLAISEHFVDRPRSKDDDAIRLFDDAIILAQSPAEQRMRPMASEKENRYGKLG